MLGLLQRSRYYAFFLMILLMSGSAPLWADKAPTTDLRVLIDISGSMKQTDPDNLRRPALKLLTGLMPGGTRSGVWTFGQYVNMAVPYGQVDADWKARARREAEALHSRGLYTHIEAALEKAAFNWTSPDPAYDRHLLLLTDGKVDVSDKPQASDESRQRILEELLPRLRRAGVKIHTVGLSDGVDRELLTTLSAASGGWYEETRDSEALQRLFLRLFEKAVTVQTLPLTNNRFVVDEKVEDITLLVFRRDGEPPLSIVSPEQHSWSEADHPSTASWHGEADYDLVTIEQPQSGEWQLQTREDPDNRVMVLTNLQLQVDPLPDHLLLQDALKLSAWLSDKGQRINDQNFLELIDFTLHTDNPPDSGPSSYPLNDPDLDGVYQRDVKQMLVAGEHTLRVRASSPTFEREQIHHLRMYEAPLTIRLEAKPGGDYRLNVNPVTALFKPESMQLSLRNSADVPVKLTREGNAWQGAVPASLSGETLTIEFQATRQDGRDLVSHVERRIGGGPVSTSAGERRAPASTAADTGNEPESEAAQELDWRWVIAMVVVTNLLLILGGLAIYAYLRKLRRDVLASEEKELEL
ncbi:MAG: vWA domain-containing protein [Thiohalophilus sp.]|uniref:vWA domain-containing protein n=1 Tax=Thiohalophilus sp. TaxID=3028392 RepID=UPI0028701627|nr:vWA domain-containing protein [Thiohalophilus sp.]MDR9435487.1 vWA domain-containing protein [Thiohalophilus sp.]